MEPASMVGWCLLVVFCFCIFKLYQVLTCGICKSDSNLTGKVVIVTGSDRGIGYATAEDLARRGARVILACVDDAVARRARDSILKATGNPDVEYWHLDLASLASVRAFAARVLATEKRLDVLINNAGVAFQRQKRTADGLIIESQVNYFGPFLLTNLLLPLLKTSSPSRIVNVASNLHYYGSTDFKKLDQKMYLDAQQYANTKLCVVMFTKELSRRLIGTGVVVNSLHPGAVRSNIYDNAILAMRWFSAFYNNVFFKTAKQGAQTSIHLAVSPECETISGKYFSDCKPFFYSPRASDKMKAKELWELSAKTVKLENSDGGPSI